MAYKSQDGRKPSVYVVPPSRMNENGHRDLPDPTPARPINESPEDREPSGKFAPGGSDAPQAAGGKAKKGSTALAVKLSLSEIPEEAALAKFYPAAERFCRAEIRHIRAHLGGGVMGPGPKACIMSAGRQKAWSLYLFDRCAKSGDVDDAIKASRLANEARQNIMAAREMAIKEASGRWGPRGRPRKDQLTEVLDAEFEDDELDEETEDKEVATEKKEGGDAGPDGR